MELLERHMKHLILIPLALLLIGAAPSRTKTYTTQTTISATDVTENENNIFSYLQTGVDTYASGSVNAAAIATDAVGSSEIAADAVGASEIADDTVTASDLSATLTFADSDFLDLSAINMSSTTEGLKLGQATSCASATAEGQLCWDSNDDDLYIGNGAAAAQIGADTIADRVIITTNATTTSATLADLTGATITMVTGANPVLLGFTGSCQHSNAAGDSINMNFQVDDTTLVLGTVGAVEQIAVINRSQICTVTAMTADQTAASHRFDVQWSEVGSGGTATMVCDSSSSCGFWAVEVQD